MMKNFFVCFGNTAIIESKEYLISSGSKRETDPASLKGLKKKKNLILAIMNRAVCCVVKVQKCKPLQFSGKMGVQIIVPL